VLYVTERCVFALKADLGQGSLELIEIAPGIDLERHILAQMDFMPAISTRLKLMDTTLFLDKPMGLRERLLETPLASRFELDKAHGLLFINFEGLVVDRPSDIDAIEQTLLGLLEPLGAKVTVVVNYDNFSISPRLFDGYSAMVRRVSERYYQRVTRYGTGGFLKARLEALISPRE
jgi:propionate CoA-transferase